MMMHQTSRNLLLLIITLYITFIITISKVTGEKNLKKLYNNKYLKFKKNSIKYRSFGIFEEIRLFVFVN